MTEEEFIDKLTEEVKNLDTYLERDDYVNALSDASAETGWAIPEDTAIKVLWLKKRAKRHIFFYLYTESAHKFKYKQINLQQRWEHYADILKVMDEEFLAFQEERPDLFGDVEPFHMFGTKIDAGFGYEGQTGKDITYSEVNEVDFTPKEND
jgi:hypothetical protein